MQDFFFSDYFLWIFAFLFVYTIGNMIGIIVFLHLLKKHYPQKYLNLGTLSLNPAKNYLKMKNLIALLQKEKDPDIIQDPRLSNFYKYLSYSTNILTAIQVLISFLIVFSIYKMLFQTAS